MDNKYKSIPIGKSGIFRGVNPLITVLSTIVVVGVMLVTLLNVEEAGQFYSGISSWMFSKLNWFFVLSISLFLLFILVLICSKYGQIRLGDDHEKPEFSSFSWFSMLFGAGMGIGLLFWSIGEPLYHFQSNPFMPEGAAKTLEGAETAIQVTFFHWGFHAWAAYAVVGLAMAYFAYRKKLPLSLRSVLYPVLGDRIHGWPGHLVDVLAIFGTVFGVGPTLGIGAQQVNVGLNHLFGLPESEAVRFGLILVISAIATFSAVTGVRRGIKFLSELNMHLSIILLLAFIILGPTAFVLGLFSTSLGEYLGNVVPWGFWVDAQPDRQWQGWWTIFYWGWWIAWAPFVGVFIARISRGRTVREFCLGVLIVPPLLTFFWMAVFGGTGLYQELWGDGNLLEVVKADISKPIFVIIDGFDVGFLSNVLSLIVIVLVITYFVTTADSGILVVSTLLAMGNEHPPVRYRIFWGMVIGAVSGVLMLAGGLKALQTASLVASLPICFIIFMIMYGLIKAFANDAACSQEQEQEQEQERDQEQGQGSKPVTV